MQITPLICLVLASTTSVAQSISIFNCSVNATYDIYDDPDDPLLPTASEKIWATTKIMSAYNAVHVSDYNMESINFTSFSYQGTRADGDFVKASALRGVDKEPPLGAFRRWRMNFKAKTKQTCSLCRNGDDTDAALKLLVNLDDTVRWAQAWCDELQQGGKLVYEYAFNCNIQLSGCALTAPNKNAGDYVKVPKTLAIIPGSLAVGTGMEEVEAEANVEIAAKELRSD